LIFTVLAGSPASDHVHEDIMSTIHDLPAPLAHRIPDACRRLGIGRSSLYELIRTGEVRTIKIGSRTLIPEAELQNVIDSRLQVAA